MTSCIGAFSSDSRELYKANIYKALSVPNGFIIHFRYKFKYVDDDILKSIKNYIGRDVIIFHSIYNDVEGSYQHIPVRKAKLINAKISNDTELFHAYCELTDFCNVVIETLTEKTPPAKFFTTIQYEELEHVKWRDKIDCLKNKYPDFCFYYIKSIETVRGCKKNIKISNDKNGCFYCLNHGKKYLIRLSIANPEINKCKLRFNSSTDDISANISNPIYVSAQFDDITVPIYIKSLSVSIESSFISFTPEIDDKINSEYSLNIEIKKKISICRSLYYGICSLFAIASIWILKESAESIFNNGNWDWSFGWLAILSSIILLVFTTMLFAGFNKK
jgi:hypothetical protein